MAAQASFSSPFTVVGYIGTAVMNTCSTLMIDLLPGQSSSVTACVSRVYFTYPVDFSSLLYQNNLVRCTLSAVIVSVIDLMMKSMGIGWTYVFHCGMALLSLPLLYLSMHIGPRYRVKRQRQREEEMARARGSIS